MPSCSTFISHRATHVSTENRTFRVTVNIDPSLQVNPNLISTLHIFDYINPEALLIPVSVISENASGDEFVFAIDKDNQANFSSVALVKATLCLNWDSKFILNIQGELDGGGAQEEVL